jgi:hypothetical protein
MSEPQRPTSTSDPRFAHERGQLSLGAAYEVVDEAELRWAIDRLAPSRNGHRRIVVRDLRGDRPGRSS